MAELIPLAIASAFWPILLVVVIVSLRAAHPMRLLLAFLAGGLMTTVTMGLVVIYALQDSSLTGRSQSNFDPAVEIAAGAFALLAALVLWRRLPPPAPDVPTEETEGEPGRIELMLDRGAPLAFVAGVVFNILPGIFPLVALKDIAEMNIGFAETVAVLLCFYVIMFALIELPIISYLVSPDWTDQATHRFNAWLGRNARRVGIIALAVVGIYLIVKGIVAALD